MDVKLGHAISRHELVNVKDTPTVSFAKRMRAIAGTINKLQIPAINTPGKGMANYPV